MDDLPVDRDFERASARRNQSQRFDLLFELEKLFRQTDGMGLVVSGRAIFDAYVQIHDGEDNEKPRTHQSKPDDSGQCGADSDLPSQQIKARCSDWFRDERPDRRDEGSVRIGPQALERT